MVWWESRAARPAFVAKLDRNSHNPMDEFVGIPG